MREQTDYPTHCRNCGTVYRGRPSRWSFWVDGEGKNWLRVGPDLYCPSCLDLQVGDPELKQLRTLGTYFARDENGTLTTLALSEALTEREGHLLYKTPLGATPTAIAEILRELARQVEKVGFES